MRGEALHHEEPVLLYDGLCGFCNRVVRFVLARDRHGTMRFAPMQGEFAGRLYERRPELRSVDSLIVVVHADGHETVLAHSDAVIAVGRYVGGVWMLWAALLRATPKVLRDAAYDALARRRRKLFRRYDVCPLPAPEVSARFID